MSIASISPEGMKALEEHGHPDYWEIAYYGCDDSVTVECTRCGIVLVELVNTGVDEDDVLPEDLGHQ